MQFYILTGILGGALAFGAAWAARFLLSLPASQWTRIVEGAGATTLRVILALLLSALWTIPAGVLVGLNPRAASWIQPVVQIAASIPATALFPVLVMGPCTSSGWSKPGGGAPHAHWKPVVHPFQHDCGGPGHPSGPQIHRAPHGAFPLATLADYFPALFPYLVTGVNTASGGAWNASIVAEHVTFGGHTLYTVGLGPSLPRPQKMATILFSSQPR